MYIYIRRWHFDGNIVNSITFSRNVTRISVWKSDKSVDFGDRSEDLLTVMVWFPDDHTETYDDVLDVEVM